MALEYKYVPEPIVTKSAEQDRLDKTVREVVADWRVVSKRELGREDGLLEWSDSVSVKKGKRMFVCSAHGLVDKPDDKGSAVCTSAAFSLKEIKSCKSDDVLTVLVRSRMAESVLCLNELLRESGQTLVERKESDG